MHIICVLAMMQLQYNAGIFLLRRSVSRHFGRVRLINDAIKNYPPLFGRFIIPDQHHKFYAYKSTLIINMSASLEPQTAEKPSAAKVSDFICLEIDECIAYRQGFSDSVGVIVGQVLEGVLVEPLDELERLDTTLSVHMF